MYPTVEEEKMRDQEAETEKTKRLVIMKKG